ncbi:MAG TPA: hypothetical protein VGI45_31310 [Terracidiphilus sp.]
MREILTELRSIHEDMRVTETTQLLVAELEMQQGVVNRAMESADNASIKLNGIHVDQRRLAAEMTHVEEQIDKAANADEKNALAQENERRKVNVETMKNIEHEASTSLQFMEQRLQNAQDKLSSIESELNAAISRLGPAVKDAAQK